ncbi:glutamine gamma-glutamyltransferase [Labeo rohita]|uniref:Glutamine gamma-glutamyltransferase n=1 Tax=Labeo rohita TaxID=84645 RepID=A0A498LWP5_LABRO|nr:glutamine gamma-glutamyltransferase [Labeo rohita]RXN25489.1 glutamine gamma-glutamyltransferase [Labeo rohita]
MASLFGSKPNFYPSPTNNNASFEIIMDGAGPRIVEDVKLSIILKNKSLLYEYGLLYGHVLHWSAERHCEEGADSCPPQENCELYYIKYDKLYLKSENLSKLLTSMDCRQLTQNLNYTEGS